MQNCSKIICEIFELEMWLYIDKALNDERMEFWRTHLRQCTACKEKISQAEELVFSASENLLFEMDDNRFDEMISVAIRKKRKNYMSGLFERKKKKIISVGKIVFASSLVVVAVLISLLSDKPNSVKSVGKEILEWEGGSIKAEIENISNKINMINQSDWDRQMFILDQKIELIEKNTDNFSFN